MTHRQKMALGWLCYGIWMCLPLKWWPWGLEKHVLAWAGYYAHEGDGREHREFPNP